MARAILRLKQAISRLGCRRTKFAQDYRWHSADDPYVPGTAIRRIKAIPLGLRNVGFLDNEIDELIDALAALRDAEPSPPPASKPLDAPRGPRSKPKRNAVKREQARTAHEDRDQALTTKENEARW